MLPRADCVRVYTQKPREHDLAHTQEIANPAHVVWPVRRTDEFNVTTADREPCRQRLAGPHDINGFLERGDDLGAGRRELARARGAGGRLALGLGFLFVG